MSRNHFTRRALDLGIRILVRKGGKGIRRKIVKFLWSKKMENNKSIEVIFIFHFMLIILIIKLAIHKYHELTFLKSSGIKNGKEIKNITINT